MSLVTSCPACGTRFKIVPDQLKVSEGWVRCGTCSEVFDAAKRLEDPDAPHPPGRAHLPVLIESLSPDTDAALPSPSMEAPAEPAPALEPTASAQEASTDAVSTPLETAPVSEPELPPSPEILLQVTGVESITTAPDVNPDDLGFIKAARRQAMWQRPSVRIALGLFVTLLSLALISQHLHHERDRLAARHPQLSATLVSLCAIARCDINAPREPDAIVIDSSRFQKQLSTDSQSDVYQLEVHLKNRADHPIAWPDIELSLTAGAEQPVVRHVIPSARYAPNPATAMAAGMEYTARLALKVDTQALGSKVSGYRVMIFYP